MNTTETLLIRACKSNARDRIERVLNVFARQYYPSNSRPQRIRDACLVLSDIVDKYQPLSTAQMIEGLAPRDKNIVTSIVEQKSYWERALEMLIMRIAFTKGSSLPGYRPPLKFRKPEVENV